MASKRIRRLIELVLDEVAAKKAERATQDSLRRGTDPTVPEKNLSSIERSLTRLKGVALKVGAALGIGGTIVLGLRKIVRESIEAQNAQAQLEAVLTSTGQAAGRSAEQLNEQAAALQKVTTFSDDAVTSAQALLLTFTNIKGKVFDEAVQNVLDLATAMGGDLKGAAVQVGKALNDPVKGITALQKVGVSFTKEQKEQIKTLAETGHLMEAQGLIQRELRREFEGSARAARDTLGGALKGLENAFGDLFEASRDSTRGIIGVINRLTDSLSSGSGLLPMLLRGLDHVINGLTNAWANVRLLIAGMYQLMGDLASHIPGLGKWSQAWTKAGNSLQTTTEMAFGIGRFARMGPHNKRPMQVIAEDTEDAADATDKLAKAEDARLKLLTQAVNLGIDRPSAQRELLQVILDTTDALAKQNVPLEEQVRLTERLNAARAALTEATTTSGAPVPKPEGPSLLPEPLRKQGLKLPIKVPGTITQRTTKDVPDMGKVGTFLVDNFDAVQDAAQVAALGIQQAFTDAFQALFTEGEGLSGFFKEIFEGMASSALNAIAEVAAAKVVENLAYALESLALGFLGDPKAYAAAATFAKAAAAWAVVGGIAGAASKAAGGGAAAPGGSPVERQVDKIDRTGPDIVLHIDGVDPNNPRHQRAVGEASREYTQRYGGRVRMERG